MTGAEKDQNDEELAAARAAELVEVVDRGGNVERVVTRAQMRLEVLRHRSTYVMVVNSQDELLVHRRALWKDVYPGYWDIAFGGVCDVGEDWDAAAERELFEEAGISGSKLQFLGEGSYEESDGKILGRAYLVQTDDPPICEDGEVIATDYVPMDQLDVWLAAHSICRDSEAFPLPLLRVRVAVQLGQTSGKK